MRDVLAVYDPGRGVRQILPFAAAGYSTLEQFAVAPPEPRRLEGLAIAIVGTRQSIRIRKRLTTFLIDDYQLFSGVVHFFRGPILRQ